MEPECEGCGNRLSRCTCDGRDPGPDPSEQQSRLKIALNTVLWSRLPGTTTLEEAETIALDILEAVENELYLREQEAQAALQSRC